MDTLKELREKVCEANLELVRKGLVLLTWGNVSGIDREKGILIIKPSGVEYERLTLDMLVPVDINSGIPLENRFKPSSDTPTHLELYRSFPLIGGITHTHSTYASAFAQAMREIPCLGTTHADYFYGPVPVTRRLSPEEIAGDYETNTGKAITELFIRNPGKILDIPAALVSQHGPFTWGKDAGKSVEASVVLEETARMASVTFSINSSVQAVTKELLNKHFLRKHGNTAYYGQ